MQSVGVLALQGSFSEHLTKLAQLTEVLPVAVKTAADLEQVDRLILPGGESTAISRLLQRTGLSELLKRRVKEGLPVWGTCAGLILLAKNIVGEQPHLGVMDIRAPWIERVGEQTEILGEYAGHIIAARQGKLLATSFHPELTDSDAVYRYFLQL